MDQRGLMMYLMGHPPTCGSPQTNCGDPEYGVSLLFEGPRVTTLLSRPNKPLSGS